MVEAWDEQERRTDVEQALRPIVRVRRATKDDPWAPGPGHAPNFAVWQRWGFPGGLTIGILIGFFVAFALFFLWMLARGVLG